MKVVSYNGIMVKRPRLRTNQQLTCSISLSRSYVICIKCPIPPSRFSGIWTCGFTVSTRKAPPRMIRNRRNVSIWIRERSEHKRKQLRNPLRFISLPHTELIYEYVRSIDHQREMSSFSVFSHSFGKLDRACIFLKSKAAVYACVTEKLT